MFVGLMFQIISRIAFCLLPSYSRHMAELDELWINLLRAASKEAEGSGRHAMADYFRLKLANDTIRSAAVKWLLDTAIDAAFELHRAHPSIKIQRIEPHRFSAGSSIMVGGMLQIQQGVRCLSVEAGWARTPSDGIMRNGALAHARFSHFGILHENADLMLVRADPLPLWLGKDGVKFTANDIRKHLDIFLRV